jgi:hypothetical protein
MGTLKTQQRISGLNDNYSMDQITRQEEEDYKRRMGYQV